MRIDNGARSIDASSSYVSSVKLNLIRLNEWIRQTCAESSIPLVDLFAHFGDRDRPDVLRSDMAIGDNAHLNVDGQRLIASLLWEGYFSDAEGTSAIVCLGDSHTQGFPMRTDVSRNGEPIDLAVDEACCYPYFLAELTGSIVINRGIAGNTVYGMKNRFTTEVLPHLPDHCVVLGGTNDLLIGTPLEDTKEDLATIFSMCQEAGITPVACTIVPLGF